MNDSLNGQIALVTGASRGIGHAIAMQLGAQGATVIGTATSQAGADAISQGFSEGAVKGRGQVLEVGDAAACEALVDSIIKEFGSLPPKNSFLSIFSSLQSLLTFLTSLLRLDSVFVLTSLIFGTIKPLGVSTAIPM